MLLKRRMLMQAGWPREALLITVVRDKHGDGHAVLTVKTDKGEYILDNQNDKFAVVGNRLSFVKRQSQADPMCGFRSGAAQGAGDGHLALIFKELRPGHVPTPPVPDRFARPALPQSRPHLLWKTLPGAICHLLKKTSWH